MPARETRKTDVTPSGGHRTRTCKRISARRFSSFVRALSINGNPIRSVAEDVLGVLIFNDLLRTVTAQWSPNGPRSFNAIGPLFYSSFFVCGRPNAPGRIRRRNNHIIAAPARDESPSVSCCSCDWRRCPQSSGGRGSMASNIIPSPATPMKAIKIIVS
jgi:hypothetical protein